MSGISTLIGKAIVLITGTLCRLVLASPTHPLPQQLSKQRHDGEFESRYLDLPSAR